MSLKNDFFHPGNPGNILEFFFQLLVDTLHKVSIFKNDYSHLTLNQ